MPYALLSSIFLILQAGQLNGCDDNGPLGLISGSIKDWQITASSTYPQQWDQGCHEKFARLYLPNGLGWCAKYKSAAEWIQVDLGVPAKITGVITQGRGDGEEWVTSFKVSYSPDGYTWYYITDPYGSQRVFDGNKDAYSSKHSYFDEPIEARYVKLHTTSWHRHPSMKLELLGCQKCKKPLGMPPYGKISTSSHQSFKKGSSCLPEDGYILSNNAWCPRKYDTSPWIQFDIGPPTLITGIITKGRGDTGKKHWVTGYKVLYSNNTGNWTEYTDPYQDTARVFEGNEGKYVPREHYFEKPFTAKYIRVVPVTYHRAVGLRVGLIGCPQPAACENGYMKINEETPCIENLAFNQPAFLNDQKRHSKRQAKNKWTKENAFRAVDGYSNSSIQTCTVLDNYFVDKPIWMVDLGKRMPIEGVLVMTWSATDRYSSGFDFMHNLEKLSVYVDTREGADESEENLCETISSTNSALRRPKLHFPCRKNLKGRYVYIRAYGSGTLYSAVLCEVMIYS